MDKVWQKAWDEYNPKIKEWLRGVSANDIDGEFLFRGVLSVLFPDEQYGEPDPDRITVIDHGDYQGTLLFVVGECGYQPSTYWATSYGYGSCSGCDTLLSIANYRNEMTDEKIELFWTEGLHMVQGIRQIAGYDL